MKLYLRFNDVQSRPFNEYILGEANMSVVPRIGEDLYLNVAGRESSSGLGIYRFRVEHVAYSVLNMLQTETGVQPWPTTMESSNVVLYVKPVDQQAQAYLQRIISAEQET